MTRKVKSKKIYNADPYFAISSPLLSIAIPQNSYNKLAANFFFASDSYQFKQRLNSLLERDSFRSALNGYSNTIENFFSKPIRSHTNIDNAWISYSAVFLRESDLINKFIRHKNKFEHSFLIADYKQARESIESSKQECGESIWYVNSKSLLLSHMGSKDEFDSFSNECEERAPNIICKDIFKYIRIFNDSNDAHYPLTNILKRVILEFKEGGFNDGAATYSALFVPYPILSSDEFEIPLNYINYFPIVDQYLLLIDFFQKETTRVNSKQSINIKQLAIDLMGSIHDDQLSKLIENSQISSVELSDTSKSIFQSYVEGKYEKVIFDFEHSLPTISNPFIFVNIVAKSFAILKKRPTPEKNIVYQIIENFIFLYDTSKPQKLLEHSILSHLIKLKSFKLFNHLQSCLYFSLPNKYECLDIKKSADLALLSFSELNPLVENYSFGRASRFATFIPDSINDYDEPHRLKLEISELIEANGKEDLIEERLGVLKKVIELEKDFIELFSEFCLKYKKYSLLISESVDALLNNPELAFSIPLSVLVDIINTEHIVSIESIYLVYFFNKNVSNKKEEILNELFEDYLIQNEVERPSELILRKQNFIRLDIVFFADICSIDIMDFLTVFPSSIELLIERVRILDLLLERELIDQERRLQEVELIVSEFLIESTSKKLNAAKISVNEIAIIKSNQDHIQLLLNQFHESVIDDGKLVKLPKVDMEASASYLTGSKDGIVVNIIKVLRDGFINDDKYGLDKNLSTEIRHGFFSDFVRAKFLEKKLLTEVNDKNTFENNKYWRDKHSVISTVILDDVDNDLKDFSKGLNDLLSEAEEWMKVVYSSDQKSRLFVYSNLEMSYFQQLKSRVVAGANVSEISNQVMNMMWEITENTLTKIREKIHTEFRAKVYQLLDTLLNKINRSKRGTSMKELIEAIAQAKSEIQEVITTVAEWFNRTNVELESRNLNQVLEISTKTFKSIKGTSILIDLDIDAGFSKIIIDGKHIKPYVIAIFNLLDNALRHSGLGKDTKVTIKGVVVDKPVIVITNNISQQKSEVFTNEYMESIRGRLESQISNNLAKVEGGSGLVKAQNELKLISVKTKLCIDCEDDTFIVRIDCG